MKIHVPEVADYVGVDNPEVFQDVLNVFDAKSAVSGQKFIHIFLTHYN